LERETGLEPATTCLEDAEKARRAPLAPFLHWIIGKAGGGSQHDGTLGPCDCVRGYSSVK